MQKPASASADATCANNRWGLRLPPFFVLAAAQTHPARIGVFVSAQDLHAPGKYIYLCNRRVAYCIAYILSVERKV
jgi:hypothetical protein